MSDGLTFPVEWTDLVLEKRRLAAVSSVTRQLLQDASLDVSDTLGFVTDTLLVKLEAFVTAVPDGHARQDIELVSGPVYDSWQAQRVDSLPAGSLRRRFWGWRYGLDPSARHGYRVRQTVNVEKDALLPEDQHAYPGHGPMHVVVRTGSAAKTREPSEPVEIKAQHLLRAELP